MIPADEELRLFPDDMEADDAPEIKVELPEMTAEQAFVAMVQRGMDPGGYHVEMSTWTARRERVKLSTTVQIPRAILKALITMQAIVEEYEENTAHLARLKEAKE